MRNAEQREFICHATVCLFIFSQLGFSLAEGNYLPLELVEFGVRLMSFLLIMFASSSFFLFLSDRRNEK